MKEIEKLIWDKETINAKDIVSKVNEIIEYLNNNKVYKNTGGDW